MQKIVIPGDPRWALMSNGIDVPKFEGERADQKASYATTSTLYGMSGTEGPSTNMSTGTLIKTDKMLDLITTIKQQMDAYHQKTISCFMPGPPLQVRESGSAIRPTRLPKKIHIRTRLQSKKSHLLAQKEFNKKYGYLSKPTMYLVDGDVFGHPQRYLVVHPSLYEQVSKIINESNPEKFSALVNKIHTDKD